MDQLDQRQMVIAITIKAFALVLSRSLQFQCAIYPVIDSDSGDERSRQEGSVFEADQEASFTHPAVSQQHHLDIKTSVIHGGGKRSCKLRLQNTGADCIRLDKKMCARTTLNWAHVSSSTLTAD